MQLHFYIVALSFLFLNSRFLTECHYKHFGKMFYIDNPFDLPPPCIKGAKPPSITLFIDLDETLVDARHTSYIVLRPHAKYFIESLSKSGFELIIWSAASKEHVIACCKLLDPDEKYLSGAIHMGFWTVEYGIVTKNLNSATSFRSIDRMLLLDNTPYVGRYLPTNIVCIPDFISNEQSQYDDMLYDLVSFMQNVQCVVLCKRKSVQDVIQHHENIRVLQSNFGSAGSCMWSIFIPQAVIDKSSQKASNDVHTQQISDASSANSDDDCFVNVPLDMNI